jgi:hypothetical protein
MPFNITNFKSRFNFGGARACLFQAQLTLPEGVNTEQFRSTFAEKFSFTCKSASIPGSSVSNIEIPFQGRKVYCAGNRVFEPWTVTVLNDEDFLVRKAFELWLSSINGHSTNQPRSLSFGSASPKNYQTDAIVKQFSQQDTEFPIATYTFKNLFPTDISPIELDWNETDSVEQFNVTFRYDYWT